MGRRTPGSRWRPRIFKRAARFIGPLFSSDPPPDTRDEEEGAGGLGVREPRRPLHPTQSGAVALEPPPTEMRDVWAVGEDDDR